MTIYHDNYIHDQFCTTNFPTLKTIYKLIQLYEIENQYQFLEKRNDK